VIAHHPRLGQEACPQNRTEQNELLSIKNRGARGASNL